MQDKLDDIMSALNMVEASLADIREDVEALKKEQDQDRPKFYKLQYELPTFRKGDIFELCEDGCLYFDAAKNGKSKHYKRRIMAYHAKTIEAFPNILGEWFTEVEE